MQKLKRAGFVVDGMIPSWQAVLHGRCGIRGLLRGMLSNSSLATMRFGWIAREINRRKKDYKFCYELYRPLNANRYDFLVFLKSMGRACMQLASRLRRNGTKIIFDINVDYYTIPEGRFIYEGMEPTKQQRDDAISMTGFSDAIIADSEYVAEKSKIYNNNVCWIPDNVDMKLVPSDRPKSASLRSDGKLKLLWSGEAVKLFDLLVVERVIKKFADHIMLLIITNDCSALNRWFGDYKERFESLLQKVEHTIIPFSSINQLFTIYSQGGVLVSPRMLDNTYNLGHTEWKITLAMACGCFVLCSPQPSYITVFKRAGGKGIRICESDENWEHALDEILSNRIDMNAEGFEARRTVERYYSTKVVAQNHADFLRSVQHNEGQSVKSLYENRTD